MNSVKNWWLLKNKSCFIQETGEILAFNPQETNQTLHVVFMTRRHKEQTVLLNKEANCAFTSSHAALIVPHPTCTQKPTQRSFHSQSYSLKQAEGGFAANPCKPKPISQNKRSLWNTVYL